MGDSSHPRLPVRICFFPRTDGKIPDPTRTKYVGRTGRFGNPHDHKVLGRAEAVRRYRADWDNGTARFTLADVADLAQYDELACRCPVDGEPCHADVLIDIIRELNL